ncbi:MAG: hypothetical protein ACXWP5_11945 [Bdellovibrionota bacterium]
MKRISAISIALLLGCAAIPTKGGLPATERALGKTQVPVSFRALVLLRKERHGEVTYTLRSDPAFRRSVEKALKDSGNFSDLHFRALLKPTPVYSADQLGELESLLNPLSQPGAPASLSMSWYEVEDADGSSGWELVPYSIYGLVHVGSLGIIPFFWPHSHHVLVHVADAKGKLLATQERDITAWSISWFPFYFRGDLKSLQSPDFWDRLHENQNQVLIQDLSTENHL